MLSPARSARLATVCRKLCVEGSELIVGEATVKTHVARILAKLNLRDRIQAVVFAYETRLIEPGANPVTP